ncbi:MAG: glycosyltransferase family 4 protein [Vampirovibrionales bacterium]|nr:glycosyltransferase family 4 protein [Vampirovibrionales bacterium]
MTLKAAYLISRYPALSHTFILREIQELSRLGWDIHIASINAPDRPMEALLNEERTHAEKTFYVKKSGLIGALKAFSSEAIINPLGLLRGLGEALRLGGYNLKEFLYFLFYFVEAVMVAHWMRQNNLKHLHVHFAGPASSVGIICKRINHCRFSITVHGPDEFSAVEKSRLPQKFAATDLIICITNFAKSQVFLHADVEDWQKVAVVRVGLDCKPFLKLGERKNLLAQQIKSAKPARKEILSIGRLVSPKGQVILLEALAELEKRQCPVHLTLIGTGPLLDVLKTEADQLGLTEEAITFAGGLNQDDVKKHLVASDLFVLSSFAEGLPVVLMEALLCNIPCVSTCIAGIPELIRHEKDGLLVPAGNSMELASAIERLVQNPELAQAVAQSGKERVLAMHDIHKTSQEISRHFATLQGVSVPNITPLPKPRLVQAQLEESAHEMALK